MVNACYGDFKQADALLQSLRVLGLLKFDEPMPTSVDAMKALAKVDWGDGLPIALSEGWKRTRAQSS